MSAFLCLTSPRWASFSILANIGRKQTAAVVGEDEQIDQADGNWGELPSRIARALEGRESKEEEKRS